MRSSPQGAVSCRSSRSLGNVSSGDRGPGRSSKRVQGVFRGLKPGCLRSEAPRCGPTAMPPQETLPADQLPTRINSPDPVPQNKTTRPEPIPRLKPRRECEGGRSSKRVQGLYRGLKPGCLRSEAPPCCSTTMPPPGSSPSDHHHGGGLYRAGIAPGSARPPQCTGGSGKATPPDQPPAQEVSPRSPSSSGKPQS